MLTVVYMTAPECRVRGENKKQTSGLPAGMQQVGLRLNT